MFNRSLLAAIMSLGASALGANPMLRHTQAPPVPRPQQRIRRVKNKNTFNVKQHPAKADRTSEDNRRLDVAQQKRLRKRWRTTKSFEATLRSVGIPS